MVIKGSDCVPGRLIFGGEFGQEQNKSERKESGLDCCMSIDIALSNLSVVGKNEHQPIELDILEFAQKSSLQQDQSEGLELESTLRNDEPYYTDPHSINHDESDSWSLVMDVHELHIGLTRDMIELVIGLVFSTVNFGRTCWLSRKWSMMDFE